MSSLKTAYQQVKSMMFEYKNQREHKEQNQQEIERMIEGYKGQEEDMQSQVKAIQ